MTAVLKLLPSRERANRYRQLERDAERAAATVSPLYRESFKRMALKWRKLAEDAERGFEKRELCQRSTLLSTHARRR
jgi:hypothetical protein